MINQGNVLDRSRESKSDESDFGVIAFQIPSASLLTFITWNCDGSVLTEARCDDEGSVLCEKTINIPTARCFIDPFVIALYYEFVQFSEVLYIKPDRWLIPSEWRIFNVNNIELSRKMALQQLIDNIGRMSFK
jgi:hypothetical protein